MNYLDVNPMMQSLRTKPEDFDMSGRWLRHNPSRHCFRFERDGTVTIRAGCNCAFLMVHPEQRQSLEAAYQVWRQSYWEPLEINRHFAAHFEARSPFRRWLIRMAANLHRWLAQQNDSSYPVELHSVTE